MKAVQRINRFVARISGASMVVGGACLVLTVVLINVEVVGRYIFDFSTLICDEYSGYLFSMLTMFGLVYSLNRGHFLRVTFLSNQLPPRVQYTLLLLACVLGLLFSAIITYHVAKVPHMSWILDTKSIGSETSLFFPQLFLPVGMAMLTVEFLNQALNSLCLLLYGEEGNQ